MTGKTPFKSRFERFLIRKGYRQWTPSGNPSTVYSYSNAVDKVCGWESCSWETLSARIDFIVAQYDIGGSKELLGAKSHNTVISALKQFELFCN